MRVGMFKSLFFVGLLVWPSLAGCGGDDVPVVESLRVIDSDGGMLYATVHTGETFVPTSFNADEVVANLSINGRERELVIYARSYDLSETLAFVLDLDLDPVPGVMDLSSQGVLYLEPGFGTGGADLIFDEDPRGYIEIEGDPTPGNTIHGRFAATLAGYDSARPGEELAATLEGSFVLQVGTTQP